MARKWLSKLTLRRGRVVLPTPSFDYLAEDDLPRVEGVAGGYTAMSAVVDQWGRIKSAANGSALSPLSPDPTGSYTAANITVNAFGQVTAAASGAGGSPWTQSVNESGASFANFTAASGTWSSDGTQIKQTDTTAASRLAKYNTPVVTGGIVLEAKVQVRTAGADKITGLLVGFDGTNAGAIGIRINQSGSVQLVCDQTSTLLTVLASISVNTYYTLRMVVFGGVVSAYLDGVLIGSAGNNGQRSNDATYIGLFSFGAESWFKDLKAYNLTLP